MANQRHLAILRQGVLAFNAYRKDHPNEVIDLSGAVFHDETFIHLDLSGANLRFSSWRGCVFDGGSLEVAIADHADFNGASFVRGVKFTGASLHNADLDNAIILNPRDLESADLTGTDYGR